MQERPFKIFSGTKSRYFAEKVCNSLGCPLGNMIIEHFADGEFAVSYEESIRGKQVFLIQSTFPNSDNLMELLLMIDAAPGKQAGVRIAQKKQGTGSHSGALDSSGGVARLNA